MTDAVAGSAASSHRACTAAQSVAVALAEIRGEDHRAHERDHADAQHDRDAAAAGVVPGGLGGGQGGRGREPGRRR